MDDPTDAAAPATAAGGPDEDAAAPDAGGPPEDAPAPGLAGPPDATSAEAAPTTDEPERPARRTRGRRRSDALDLPRMATIALGVGGGLLLVQLVTAAAARLRSIILLLVLSLFLSFAMEPAVQWLHKRGVRRGVGTGLVFLAAALLGTGFVWAISGLVTDQVRNLVDAAPRLLEQLAVRAQDLPDGLAEPVGAYLDEQSALLPDRLASSAGDITGTALGIGTTLLGGIGALLAVALVTFYMVADGPQLRRTLVSRFEQRRQHELLRVWELAIAKTGGYVYSRVLLAVVSTAVHVVAFTVVDLRYAAALGVWVGLVSSVIPVVGLYIAGVLPLVVALANSGGRTALLVLVVITVYQQIENYLVQPRITEHTLALHPAVAFVSVLAGGALLGPIGALLALPAAAIIAALISTYAEEHEVVEHGLTTTPATKVRTS